jgi:hypothetical protein
VKATVVEPSSSLDPVVCENSSRGYAASIRGAPDRRARAPWAEARRSPAPAATHSRRPTATCSCCRWWEEVAAIQPTGSGGLPSSAAPAVTPQRRRTRSCRTCLSHDRVNDDILAATVAPRRVVAVQQAKGHPCYVAAPAHLHAPLQHVPTVGYLRRHLAPRRARRRGQAGLQCDQRARKGQLLSPWGCPVRC